MQEQTHPNLDPLAGDNLRLTYSNRAVQIRVGLELAESNQFSTARGGTIQECEKNDVGNSTHGSVSWGFQTVVRDSRPHMG